MKKIAQIISILTVVPILALFLTTGMYYFTNQIDIKGYLLIVLCLTVLPLLAYPIQIIIPKWKVKGRAFQRKLAFILALIGYFVGFLASIILNVNKIVFLIILAYFISGLILSFFNGIIKIKASGHACGVSGPFVLLLYFNWKIAVCLSFIFPLVFWARLSMKRHTPKELFLGTFVGMISSILAITIVGWL